MAQWLPGRHATKLYCSKRIFDVDGSYQLTIYMIEGDMIDEMKNETSRGLEYQTQEGAWARYENKRDAYDAILDEQDRQWKLDADDDEKLREAYLTKSAKCASVAAALSKQDEETADGLQGR